MKERQRRFSGVAKALLILCCLVLMQGTSGCASESNPVASSSGSAVNQENTETTEPEQEEAENESADVQDTVQDTDNSNVTAGSTGVLLSDIPKYKSDAYVAVNDNVPFFTEGDMTTEAFETYSSLDSLGRCGVAYANVCTDIMPTEDRGAIGSVKPSGWHTVKYDFVSGKYLYNRCHLIGYQLAAENANECNLITGTRYLNIDGMLPFENMVADYVTETNNHVLYRVTPMYKGDNLVASGVLMEAKSVEDDGAGILFNVFCYNVQPGVKIIYATGESSANGTVSSEDESDSDTALSDQESNEYVYITDTGTKYHKESCRCLSESKHKIKKKKAVEQGYEPCGICNP